MKYDAIVELGYRFESEWKLSVQLQDSINVCAKLYHQKMAPYIIACGRWNRAFSKDPTLPPFTEASQMKKELIALGVPETAILTEELSEDTIGNAYFTKVNIVKPKNFHNLLVVCADYHAGRVEYIFKKIYGKEYTLDIQTIPTKPDEERDKIQQLILKAQMKFLAPMNDGDDLYLKEKLYSDPFFQI